MITQLPHLSSRMNLEQINELTRTAYNKTADKYHDHFKNEISQKEYDRLLLDRFSDMLKVILLFAMRVAAQAHTLVSI